MKLEKLAALVGGSLKGDGEIEISDVRGIEDAGAGHVTFVVKKKFIKQFYLFSQNIYISVK